ncbi:MAG TPA: hypothetical protein VMU84_19905, partial [Thermoanaerobaculia bacterium]|nr:hypothetical protein [Thermoanaerobaculia bacterium]
MLVHFPVRVRALAALAVLLFICGANAVQAQTCAAPTVTQVTGGNPSCPGQLITLEAQMGFDTYVWSNGATGRVMADTPSTTTSYTVTATNAGCSVTSEPVQIVVSPPPPATISLDTQSLCPNEPSFATIPPPEGGGAWEQAQWFISHGQFIAPSVPDQWGTVTGSMVHFMIDGTAPAELGVIATDANGCSSDDTVVIEPRSIPPATISLDSPEMCPYEPTFATINPPADGGTWREVSWTITNGNFYGASYPNATGNTAYFSIDGTAPARLNVAVRDSHGCTTMGTAEVMVRSIPAATISLDSPQMCPYEPTFATIDPPANGGTWREVSWTITNGNFYGASLPNATGNTAYFSIDGSAPARLNVAARDSYGCTTMGTAEIMPRSIPAATITLDSPSMCPYQPTFATIDPPANGGTWREVSWTITNGNFYGASYPNATGNTAYFSIDGTAPARLNVAARDSYGCVTMGTVEVMPRTLPTPAILLDHPSICVAGGDNATVEPPANGSWSAINWSILNGIITGPTNQATAHFYANGSGPVTLYVNVMSSDGCMTSASANVPLRTLPPLTVIPDSTSSCANTTMTAHINPPAEGSWTGVFWSITNGSFTSPSNQPNVSFIANGNGNAVLSVNAQDSFGCTTSGSRTYTV